MVAAQSVSTESVLVEMLLENTGRSMLDSGDYYGRHWQTNAHRDFTNAPASTLQAYVHNGKLDLCLTHNVYHWLNDRITFAPKMDRLFQRFADRRPNDHWLANMEEFGEAISKHGATGIYGDGEPFTANTYNGEDLLSQTLQYLYFEFDHTEYILLQIHGGCDVRGGYTRPRAFELTSELSIFDNARACLWPQIPALERSQLKLPGMESAPEAPSWDSDNGCHFRSTGYRQYRLEDFEASDNPKDRGNGIIYVDEDRQIYCPLSGCRLLPAA